MPGNCKLPGDGIATRTIVRTKEPDGHLKTSTIEHSCLEYDLAQRDVDFVLEGINEVVEFKVSTGHHQRSIQLLPILQKLRLEVHLAKSQFDGASGNVDAEYQIASRKALETASKESETMPVDEVMERLTSALSAAKDSRDALVDKRRMDKDERINKAVQNAKRDIFAQINCLIAERCLNTLFDMIDHDCTFVKLFHDAVKADSVAAFGEYDVLVETIRQAKRDEGRDLDECFEQGDMAGRGDVTEACIAAIKAAIDEARVRLRECV